MHLVELPLVRLLMLVLLLLLLVLTVSVIVIVVIVVMVVVMMMVVMMMMMMVMGMKQMIAMQLSARGCWLSAPDNSLKNNRKKQMNDRTERDVVVLMMLMLMLMIMKMVSSFNRIKLFANMRPQLHHQPMTEKISWR
jgi:small-conductance mechanosensitive channel